MKTAVKHFAFSIALVLGFAQAASAATLVVDNTQDSNGVFVRACTSAPNDCSFWGALTAADLTIEADTIAFDIPVNDDPGCVPATQICRVRTPSAVVNVLHPITIDGYTQPGSAVNTLSGDGFGVNMTLKIEIARSLSNTQNRLFFQSSTTIRGIAAVIESGSLQSGMFSFYAFKPTQDIVIEGNSFGVFANGSALNLPIQTKFIEIQECGAFGAINPAISVRVGGSLPTQRNWIVSGDPAIKLGGCANGVGSFSAAVQGNLFGTSKDGLSAFGGGINAFSWISLLAQGNPSFLIGGAEPAEKNVFARSLNAVISSNAGTGPTITRIFGNYFGMGADGQTPIVIPLVNTGSESVLDVRRAKVGGIASGEGNLFVGNQVNSIIINPTNTSVRGNTFLANTAFLVIGRQNAGVTHPTKPEITTFAPDSPVVGTVRLNYLIASTTAQTTYPLTVEFYKAGIGNNPSQFIGRDSYQAAQAGTAKQVDFIVPAGVSVQPNDIIVASASADNDQGSSEFSRYISQLGFIGNEPAYAGVANVYRVRMQALGPFRPRGTVAIVAGLSGGSFLYRCTAVLAPSTAGPFIAEGACPLLLPNFAGQTVAIGALYNYENENFRSETDSQPTAERNVTLQAPLQDDIFRNGFEGN